MKIDAHYCAILAFCRAVGFKKKAAQTVAYASQFVDDAKINQISLANEPDEIEVHSLAQQPSLFNMATCHQYFRVNTFNYNAMINNTTAFHFVPGCKGNNFSKKLRCVEESPIIIDILDDIRENDNLVELGIGLHAYADTFSHQGFAGILSKVNAVKNCESNSKIYIGWKERIYSFFKCFFKDKFDVNYDKLNPAYGHSQVLSFPDVPYLKWQYKYDYSDDFSNKFKVTEIDNELRFRRAFKKIHSYLVKYLVEHPQYQDEDFEFDDFELLFDALIKRAPLEDRIENWKEILIDEGLFNSGDTDMIDYDHNLWLEEAFANFKRSKFDSRKVTEVALSDRFNESNWYKYYLGVSWYKDKFYKYCSKHGLEIPR